MAEFGNSEFAGDFFKKYKASDPLVFNSDATAGALACADYLLKKLYDGVKQSADNRTLLKNAIAQAILHYKGTI